MANNNFNEEQMKKNMVSSGSGLDGLLGGTQESKEEKKVADTATTTMQEADSPVPEVEQPTAPKKPRKAGRRKKVEKESGKGRHLTIVLDEQLVNKAKILAVYDGILLKDVIREALTDYVARWEKKNGEITPPKKGQDQ